MRQLLLVTAVLFASSICLNADELPKEILGRWDLVVQGKSGEFPSWLEVRKSGNSTLVGSYVGQFGSARPISEVVVTDERFSFAVPPQWEQRDDNQAFEFTLAEGKLSGTTTDETGAQLKWTGARAPKLDRPETPTWGSPIEIFNGKNLDDWDVQMDDVPNGWIVRDGVLFNEKPGNNLVTKQKFNDFKLHAEFRYPKGSNSGVYLRGRYEVQVEDNYGEDPESHLIGGVYGFLTPSSNPAKKHGEWQTYDITLVGRTVTVLLNGERVIDRQAIPGITGGALDSDEGLPGPIMLQGDHGPIEFRKLTLTPALVSR